MGDFGAPVAQNVNGPQQGVQTLSALMGLKQQQLSIAQQLLGLQQQQQQLSSQTSAATVANITATQQQALKQIDWSQFDKPDGSYDLDSATKVALKAAPNIGPAFVSNLSDMESKGTAAKQAFFNLNQQYQEPIRAAFGTWSGDPNAKLSDLGTQLEQIAQTAPAAEQKNIGQIAKNTLGLLAGPNPITGQPKTLAEQKAAALAYSRAGLTASETSGAGGIATPQPGTVSSGTQVLPVTTTAAGGNVPKVAGAPLTSLSDTITLPNNQIAVLNKQTGQYVISAGGGATPPSQPPGSSQPAMTALNDPARPPANAPAYAQQQWTAALKTTQEHVASARDADNGWGSNMAIAQDVRALSAASNTGPGTPEWTRLVGTLTSRFGGSQGVTNVQTLESFLDRQAATMTKAMGLPPTNLGNEQARTIGGNIGMQGGALRAKNDYNEALAQGLHDYRSGLDQVAGPAGIPSPTAVGQYRSQWAKYFNPTAIEYKLAQQRDDRPAMDAIAKTVGGPAGARRMKLDLEMMDSLSSTGKLP